MGIGADALALLVQLKREGYVARAGSIIEIGAQQLSNSFLRADALIAELGELYGVTGKLSLPAPIPTHVAHGVLEHQAVQAPLSRPFWEWLGYRYASVDIDGSPDSLPLDLNYDEAPEAMRGRFDLVTNFGTTEHVANQMNAFRVIHQLAAPGALMTHHLPAQGMFNHGLINYNPKFFWMLARSNGYTMLHMDFRSGEEYYELPDNILDFAVKADAGARVRLKDYKACDCMAVVVLRKTYDIAFVPPLDVPTGTPTDDAVLRQRYWTVFAPAAFNGLAVHTVPNHGEPVERRAQPARLRGYVRRTLARLFH
jgi:hypothetical protein